MYSDATESLRILQDRLVGALIGLVRATENNEHKITADTNRIILDGLLAAQPDSNADTEALTGLLSRIRTEKQRLVPDCFVCAANCGRTADYDLTSIHLLREERRISKVQLLNTLYLATRQVSPTAISNDGRGSIWRSFRKALYALGQDDWDTAQLRAAAQELCSFFPNHTAG